MSQYGKFRLINGVWVSQDSHGATQPLNRGITDGQPPGGSIRNPTHLTLQEKLKQRWFDKPSEVEIKRAMEEDDFSTNMTEVVMETKKDLASGKMRVDSDVVRDKKIIPFSHITDERGVTHVLPEDKVKKYTEEELIVLKGNLAKEIKESYDKTEMRLEGVNQSVGRPMPANPLPGEKVSTEKDLISRALEGVSKGIHKGRTFG